MAGTPYDPARMLESKTYHQKHIQLDSSEPSAYYWIGVIDWTLAYHNNRDLREEYNKTAKKTLKENDPLPAKTAALAAQNGPIVDEGINDLKKAIEIKPDYDDAMAYLNLLYRQKADLETSPDARAEDLKQADDLVDQVKAIEQRENARERTNFLNRTVKFSGNVFKPAGPSGRRLFFSTVFCNTTRRSI